MSLLAHEKDSTTSDQDNEEENPKAMGFSFPAVDRAEQALFTVGDSDNFSMMVDSGASDHYVDDKLIGPLDQEQDDKSARDQPCT